MPVRTAVRFVPASIIGVRSKMDVHAGAAKTLALVSTTSFVNQPISSASPVPAPSVQSSADLIINGPTSGALDCVWRDDTFKFPPGLLISRNVNAKFLVFML